MPDIVISLLPARMHHLVAETCVEIGKKHGNCILSLPRHQSPGRRSQEKGYCA